MATRYKQLNLNLSHLLMLLCVTLTNKTVAQEQTIYKVHTIAFYNLENLFDPLNDPLTFDDDRTPEGKDHWTETIYQKKLKSMANVIADIGKEVSGTAPTILGVAEIENRKVLEDLVNQPQLLSMDFGIIHFDSPDRRGIDVALLYQKSIFTPTNYINKPLFIYQDHNPDLRIFTRDQLVVSGMLDGELIHFIVNHWPSRSGGEARSRFKREKAAALNKKIIDSLHSQNPYAKIITMGDLNDDPNNSSVKKILGAKGRRDKVKLKELYNPMEVLFKQGLGTLAYGDSWNLFDQIILSAALLKRDYSSYRFYQAGIFNKAYLTTPRGRYKGYPYRSFANGSYTGGYSDHFPVYVYLIKKKD